jgi:hypothetical protein
MLVVVMVLLTLLVAVGTINSLPMMIVVKIWRGGGIESLCSRTNGVILQSMLLLKLRLLLSCAGHVGVARIFDERKTP